MFRLQGAGYLVLGTGCRVLLLGDIGEFMHD
jgi:hypothetical protein